MAVETSKLDTELCSYRLKYLEYLDRLDLYEKVNGESWDAVDYAEFRDRPLYDVAVSYAHAADRVALDTLCCYHGDAVIPQLRSMLAGHISHNGMSVVIIYLLQ